MIAKRKLGVVLRATTSPACIRDMARKIISYFLIFADVSRSELAEERRQNSEERYRQFLKRLPVGIYQSTADGTFLAVNSTLVKMLGYESHEELLKVNIIRDLYFSPEERADVLKKLEDCKGESVTFRLKQKDGSELWVEEDAQQVFDAQGSPIYYEGVLRDITRRKRAEDALRESEEKYGTICANIEDGYYEIDLAGNFTFFNDSLCKILGYSRDELMGLNNRKYTTGENAKKLFQSFNRVYRTGKPDKGFDWEIIRKDGTTRYVEASVSLIRNQEGEPTGFRGIVRDITERKRVEEALRKSKQRLELALRGADLGLWDWNVHTGEVIFNQRWAEMLGYSLEEIEPHVRTWKKLVHPDDMPGVMEVLNANLEGKAPFYENEHRLLTKSGEWKWILDRGKVIEWDKDGKPLRAAGTHLDITERKRAEKEIRMHAHTLRSINDCIIISDLDNNIISVNKALCDVYGYREEEIIGKNTRVLGSPRNPEELTAAILPETLKGGWRGELYNRRKDGSEFPIYLSTSVIRDGKGEPVALVGVSRDITEQKRAQEEKEKLHAQLIQAQKMESIGTLVGGIAHDFNNLLTVILGNVEFGLQDSKPGESVHRDLQKIERAATQAGNLVSQLLSFSRRQVLKPKHLNLNETIEEFSKMVTRIIGEDIELKTKLSAELPPVWADPVQIQQVLMNLCVNARDAMPQGGKLLLETREVTLDEIKTLPAPKDKSRNYVQTQITDTGVGMDTETRARIFEPFFTTKDPGKGTGLGLSVVYGIVQQHNGHIEVSSENGNGTSFKIYLPAIRTPRPADHEKKNINNMIGGDETILVVEDEETVRNVSIRILKSFGYSVLKAHNAEEAIKIFETRHKDIDLAILDVVLPKLSGPEVYKRMQSINPNLGVLFVTGYGTEAQLNELAQLEQEDIRILQKPYTKEGLGKSVRDILNLRE